MAKETTIIFVYDTELLKKEEDDPNSAILYFHPPWVSDQQKTTLCGQLMGTARCLKSLFAMPKTISLQTGNFYLIENGRYILVVGTDRNIPGWILEHRATLVYRLVNFFHKDFIALALLYQNESLNDKLYHIFDTYLKLLFLGGCVFHQMPLMDLSKTENPNVLIDSKVFLDACKSIPNILGGMLLYHNKVIHTQLSIPTSKKIIFSDPFRIKNPAELTNLDFEIPQGVKLLQVFISESEFRELFENSLQDERQADPQVLPSTSLKRDTSLLFTTVPEDETFPINHIPKKGEKKKKRPRPNSLNLKNLTLDSKGDFQVSTGKTPITPYWSQASSVCTPTSENKSFIEPDVQLSKTQVWKLSSNFNELKFNKDCAKNQREVVIKTALSAKKSSYHKSSFDNLLQTDSISQQYPNCKSIKLRRCKSVHDPHFPWTKNDHIALSQYYVEEILQIEKDKRPSIVDRKKSLTLPIKPHNASEGQKSPGGYCTPLMNKLATPANNDLLEKLNSVPRGPLIESKVTTEESCQLQQCTLFMYGERDLVLAALLVNLDKKTIENLRRLCLTQISLLENQMKMSKEDFTAAPDSNAYSILSFDREWGSVKRHGPWGEGSDLDDLNRLHGDFRANNKIDEIYLRKTDSILYANRSGPTEVYYQESAALANGLLSPSDTLATVKQTAKNRLEKTHGVFID